MNPFLLKPQERLAAWLHLRREISDLSLHERAEKVAAFWAQAPLKTIAHDVEAPNTWLTPWEMIEENDWCRSSVAIGMEQTLRLSGNVGEKLTLRVIRDDKFESLLVLEIDDMLVLNYEWGHPKSLPIEKCRSIRAMMWKGRQYVEV